MIFSKNCYFFKFTHWKALKSAPKFTTNSACRFSCGFYLLPCDGWTPRQKFATDSMAQIWKSTARLDFFLRMLKTPFACIVLYIVADIRGYFCNRIHFVWTWPMAIQVHTAGVFDIYTLFTGGEFTSTRSCDARTDVQLVCQCSIKS